MAGSSTRLARLLLLGTVSTMAFLSACGSSGSTNGEASKSADQIYADAKIATESASSVHVSGRIMSGSETLGLDFVDSSVRGGGTISFDGASVALILSGTKVYFKGSVATMTQLSDGNRAAGQLLGGRWLQTTTGNKDFGSLATLFELPKLIAEIKPHEPLKRDPVSTIDGQSVVGVTDTLRKGTLYVDTSGPPYMVEIIGGPKDPGTITFDHYGSATPPAVPTGAINLDQLEGGSGVQTTRSLSPLGSR